MIHEYKVCLRENYKIIKRVKKDIFKILKAFLKAKINLNKKVYPKLKYKDLYRYEFEKENNLLNDSTNPITDF